MSNAKLSAFTTTIVLIMNRRSLVTREPVGHAAPLRESGFSSATFHFML